MIQSIFFVTEELKDKDQTKYKSKFFYFCMSEICKKRCYLSYKVLFMIKELKKDKDRKKYFCFFFCSQKLHL